jgi:hypothetical protein
MNAHPGEAFNIARRALGGNDRRLPVLFAKAAALQEKHLARLTREQVEELSTVYGQTLGDKAAADRVRRDWLHQRERNLAQTDARGRYDLARLWWTWRKERVAAARLCQDALRLDPNLTAAEQFLRRELGYQKTGAGWGPAGRAGEEDRAARVQIGMTAADVRTLLGPPTRVSRQILDGRYVEQWAYEGRADELVEFECRRGQEARVQTVHRADGRP